MKALIVTAVFTLLAGCAGTGGYGSGDMGRGASAGGENYYQQNPQDDIFNSWVD